MSLLVLNFLPHSVRRAAALARATLMVMGLGVSLMSATASPLRAQAPQRLAALGPGDGVRLRIYREPELSGEFVIDDQGIAVLPRLGEFDFRTLPADSVRVVLRRAYQKFLASEAIEVTPFRRIAITGSVIKPGLYPVDPSVSIADAIILAGGVAPNGKLDVVELRRAGASTGTPVRAELPVWDTEAGGTKQLYVPLKPWVKRNAMASMSILVSALSATAFLITAIR